MAKIIDSLLSVGKVIFKSHASGKSRRSGNGGRLVVMGNGPSLRQFIEGDIPPADLTAVNFAGNTPEFFRLKPRHYVLADPHFFDAKETDPNVKLLWDNLSKTDWPMTLHLPANFMGDHPSSPSIEIQRFNMTPAEGIEGVCHLLYRKGLAMPRPRNVLIPAIMEGIRDGYDEIYLVGADHTWPHTLYVDDRNRVVTVQPHYYKENPRELDRIAEAYKCVRIHDVLGNMAVAFRSYHAIRRYADKSGVRIYNATPGSLIDAFERRYL